MQTNLTADEILNIFIKRYYDYQTSQGHTTCFDDVQVVLADFVESFSNGGLKLVCEDYT